MPVSRLSRIVIVVLAASARLFPQFCDNRTGAPVQMQVQLAFGDQMRGADPNDSIHRGDTVGVERSRNFSTNTQIRVQLQDPLGGTLQELTPSADGQVRISVCRNVIYRLRVTGPTIEEAVLDDLHPSRGDKLITVVLQRKVTKEDRTAPGASVSAQRLAVPSNAEKQLKKGDEALKKGKLEEAKGYYSKAIEIYPRFEEAENKLGVVLMQQGNRVEGRTAFEQAIAINDHFAPAYVNLAKIAVDERRFHDASTLAKQALASEPLNPAALFVAAESAFFKAEFNETVRCTHTLHSLPHQKYALAHFLAGKGLEAQNQFAAAISEYQIFLNEDPSDPNAERARERLRLLQLSQSTASKSAPH